MIINETTRTCQGYFPDETELNHNDPIDALENLDSSLHDAGLALKELDISLKNLYGSLKDRGLALKKLEIALKILEISSFLPGDEL
jgi:hypothetical protein